MSRKLLNIGLGVILLVIVSACAAPKSVEVNEIQNGNSVELAVGETLVITLDGNPTTGYQWEMLPNADGVMELQGEPEYKSDSNLAGSGGQYRFILKALKTGTTTVELKYYRSFEADIPPIQTFSVDVTVK